MTHANERNMALLPRLVDACIPLLRAEDMAQSEEDSWDHVRVLFGEYDSLLSEFVEGEEYRRYEVDSIVRKRSSEIQHETCRHEKEVADARRRLECALSDFLYFED